MGARWPEEGLNSTRYPCLICVLEGEADFRIGVTRNVAARNPELDPRCGLSVASLPARTFLLLPPGVPFSDGSRPHWERPHLESARSRLLWFHILPSGASLHGCSTRGATHEMSGSVFVRDAHLAPLIEAMSEEMRAAQPHCLDIAAAYLHALLLRIERGLPDAQTISGEDRHKLFDSRAEDHAPHEDSAAVARARRYIQTNLNEVLTVERIAAHSYVSPPHLNRLFRRELNQSVMQWATAQRMEMARSLLLETDLPIGRISAMSGYRHAEHFSRAFSKANGASPLAFRLSQHAAAQSGKAKPARRTGKVARKHQQ